MSDGPGEGAADAAEQWVRSWSASFSERAAAAQSLSDQVARLTAAAADDDRSITVTVNGSGAVVDLRLRPGAGHGDMEWLADEILRTMRRAQSAVAARVAAIAAETVGSDTETARAVVTSFERRFPSERGREDDERGGADASGWPFHGR